MRYKIGEYCNNGYHDSYWGVYAFNTETSEVEQIETGATAYFRTSHEEFSSEPLPEEFYPALRKFYRNQQFKQLLNEREQETVTIYCFENGTKVKANRTFRHKGKSYEKGTEFTVVGSKSFNYGRGHYSMTLEMENGSIIYTSAKNLRYAWTLTEMMRMSCEVAERNLEEAK